MTIDSARQKLTERGQGPELGLRERKKQATREALVEAALDLFGAQGFDETTVEQIAERVEVSPRTFHRYFASKDAVLFTAPAARAERVAAVFAGDDGRRPVLDVLADAIVEVASTVVLDYPRSARRFQIIEANDRLRGQLLRAREEIADLCGAHVARRVGLDPAGWLPRLVGSCAVGVLRTAHRRWLADPSLDIESEVRAGFALLADLPQELATGVTRCGART